MLRNLLRIPKIVGNLVRKVDQMNALAAAQYRRSLLEDKKYQDPLSLLRFGHKVYSQNDEDGIIQEIFARIGVTNKVFVEFGVGNGLENNTLALLHQAWTGLWIEGDAGEAAAIAKNLSETIASGRLTLLNDFITRENIDGLISSVVKHRDIDLLSVDIDGNDAHVFEAVSCISPRVVVIEYNAKFAPPISYCMRYDPKHVWRYDDDFGASLTYLADLFAGKGYSLVCCNLCGVNAFFVRDDLLGDRFQAPYTAMQHYQPFRIEIAQPSSGFDASYTALDDQWK